MAGGTGNSVSENSMTPYLTEAAIIVSTSSSQSSRSSLISINGVQRRDLVEVGHGLG